MPYYKSIVDTLKSVKNPGLYAAGGKATMPLPAIKTHGSESRGQEEAACMRVFWPTRPLQ